MVATASAKRKPGASFVSPTRVQGPKHLEHLLLLSQVYWWGTVLEVEQLGCGLMRIQDANAAITGFTHVPVLGLGLQRFNQSSNN